MQSCRTGAAKSSPSLLVSSEPLDRSAQASHGRAPNLPPLRKASRPYIRRFGAVKELVRPISRAMRRVGRSGRAVFAGRPGLRVSPDDQSEPGLGCPAHEAAPKASVWRFKARSVAAAGGELVNALPADHRPVRSGRTNRPVGAVLVGPIRVYCAEQRAAPCGVETQEKRGVRGKWVQGGSACSQRAVTVIHRSGQPRRHRRGSSLPSNQAGHRRGDDANRPTSS
jgi:hypothetical protein